MSSEDPRVRGALILAFAGACVNLQFFVDDETLRLTRTVHPERWYPLRIYTTMMSMLADKYSNPAPILEQVGIEMMKLWYAGPGKDIVERGVDFLRYQTGSEGYRSMVDGDPSVLGEFSLAELDEQAGRAIVTSTTPFSKDMERGVLRGGMTLTDDLAYVDVDNSVDQQTFVIEFH